MNTPEEFWGRTAPDGACRIWLGALSSHGHGVLKWRGQKVYAHRLAFFLRMDRWPDSDLRHLCNNPACVLHAVEGTRSENRMDSVIAGTHNEARKTHCKWGHEFTPENTRLYKGSRICRACKRVERERWPRKRSA